MGQKNIKKQPGKLESLGAVFSNINTIIWTVIGLIIFVAVIVGLIKALSNKPDENSISDNEAQTKCMLMEEADLVNLMGEPFGDATTKKAQDTCLAQWDSPDKVKAFKDAVVLDWDNRKTEVLEGYTLEQYYEEYTK